MKLTYLHESHWEIVPNYPNSLVKKRSSKKRRRLNSVPNIKSWQQGYDRKTKTKPAKY